MSCGIQRQRSMLAMMVSALADFGLLSGTFASLARWSPFFGFVSLATLGSDFGSVLRPLRTAASSAFSALYCGARGLNASSVARMSVLPAIWPSTSAGFGAFWS